MRTELMNAVVLAYIGDAVLETRVREHIILDLNIIKPNLLQQASIAYVSAKAQAAFIDYALKENIFTEEEFSFYRRGKNAKETRVLKNTSPLAHSKSTGFEAVIGHLHLNHNEERLAQLFTIYEAFVEQRECKDEKN